MTITDRHTTYRSSDLLERYEGLIESADRKHDTVRNADFLQQFGNVGLNGTFYNPQGKSDLLIRLASNQHFQHLLFAYGEVFAAHLFLPVFAGTVYEQRQHLARGPNQALTHGANGIYKLCCRCRFINVSLCTVRKSGNNGIVVL